ncbi:MAG: hypothetical protein K6A23_04990, partial [Butyrivibrio sp.]|nr:hypothetical protein [Butyrivibrio sp.]
LSIAAIAAVLTIGITFTTPAYAASVTTTTEIEGVGRTEAEAAGGQVLGATRDSVSTTGVKAGKITDKNAINGLSDLGAVANLINQSAQVNLPAAGISILDSMEITPDAGVEVSEANPLYISFKFPAITANTKAYVLHFGKNGWEVVPSTVSNGLIIAKFTSLSPVAVVVETETLQSSVLGANKAKSPRTGDSRDIVIVACAVAVLVAGGIVIKNKKAIA